MSKQFADLSPEAQKLVVEKISKLSPQAQVIVNEKLGLKPTEEKGFLRRSAEAVVDSPALPIAGGIVGGILGLPSGPGAVGTAALGGAGGEAYRQLAARALGMEAPQTSTEAAKKIGISATEQGVGEAVGSFVAAPALKVVGNVLKKPAGDLFQIITKIKPEDAATLFKNPKAILPGQWKKAQAAWRAAAEGAGIPVDDVSPEIINALKKDARSTVFDAFEKISAGEKVTASEAQTAKQALDIALMPAAKTERNKPLVALYGKMRQKFTERIGEESPELAAANKQYAVAKAGGRFRSLFPRNMDNSPAYFRSSILPSLFLGAGAARGDTTGGAIKGAAVAGLSSPLAIGSLLALAGGARGLAPYAGRAAIQSLANLAGEKFKGQ